MSNDKRKIAELIEEYQRLAHAMQAGVAFSPNKEAQEPKHLRVGINAAMSDHGASVELLIEKSVSSEIDYFEKAVKFMRQEVEDYKKELAQGTDTKIELY